MLSSPSDTPLSPVTIPNLPTTIVSIQEGRLSVTVRETTRLYKITQLTSKGQVLSLDKLSDQQKQKLLETCKKIIDSQTVKEQFSAVESKRGKRDAPEKLRIGVKAKEQEAKVVSSVGDTTLFEAHVQEPMHLKTLSETIDTLYQEKIDIRPSVDPNKLEVVDTDDQDSAVKEGRIKADVSVTPAVTTPSIKELKSEKGSSISHEHKIAKTYVHGKKKLGTESIDACMQGKSGELEDTIQMAKNMKAQLEAKLVNTVDEPQKKEIQASIDYYDKKIALAGEYLEKKNMDWLSSNYWRDLIKEIGDYNEAVKNYISAPINMRYHSLEVEGSEPVGLMRLGVISDMRNGWISLRDLKNSEKSDGELLHDALDKMVGKKGLNISGFSKAKFPNANKRAQALMNYFEGKKKPLSLKLQGVQYALGQLSLLSEPGGREKLVQDRERILGDQMLQLVAGQMARNPKLKDGKVQMADVRLLNGFSQSLDSTGWMHDEAVEMGDMAEIFKTFNDYTIQFGNKGPAVDGKKIYLPRPANYPDNGPKEVTLKTHFMNISVQGDTSNTGTQKEINDTSVLKEEMDWNKQAYGVAVDAIMKLMDEGYVVSAGCLSAKDRTGAVVAIVKQEYLYRKNKQYLNEKGFSESPFAGKIFDEDMPASRVVQLNTGEAGLKVNPWAIRKVVKASANLRLMYSNAAKYIRPLYALSSNYLAMKTVEILTTKKTLISTSWA